MSQNVRGVKPLRRQPVGRFLVPTKQEGGSKGGGYVKAPFQRV